MLQTLQTFIVPFCVSEKTKLHRSWVIHILKIKPKCLYLGNIHAQETFNSLCVHATKSEFIVTCRKRLILLPHVTKGLNYLSHVTEGQNLLSHITKRLHLLSHVTKKGYIYCHVSQKGYKLCHLYKKKHHIY